MDIIEQLTEKIKSWEDSYSSSVSRKPKRKDLIRNNQSVIVRGYVDLWLNGHLTWDEMIDESLTRLQQNIVEVSVEMGLPSLSDYFVFRTNYFISKHSKEPSIKDLSYEIFQKEVDQAMKLKLNGLIESVNDFQFTTTQEIEEIDLYKVQSENVEWAKIEVLNFMISFYDLLITVSVNYRNVLNTYTFYPVQKTVKD